MKYLWFLGFFVGVLLAQLGLIPNFTLLAVIVGLVLFCCRRYLWLVLGYVWGSQHNAPLIHEKVEVLGVQIVRSNALQFLTADRVVQATLKHNSKEAKYRVRARPSISTQQASTIPRRREHFIFPHPTFIPSFSDHLSNPILRLRLYLEGRAAALPDPVHIWILRMLLASGKGFPSDLANAFKLMGLLHILVISGLHITIITHTCQRVLRVLCHVPYVLKLISPYLFFHISRLIPHLSVAISVIYGCLIGFSIPAQRAVLLFWVMQLYPQVSFWQQICRALFLQTLFFPIGILSDSSLLSWGAYLIIVHCYRRVSTAKSLVRRALLTVLQGQLVISVMIACFFSELCLLSIPINLMVLPLVPFILFSAFLLLILPSTHWASNFLQYAHLLFLHSVEYGAEVASRFSWLWLRLDKSFLLHVSMLVVLVVVLLGKASFLQREQSTKQTGTGEKNSWLC